SVADTLRNRLGAGVVCVGSVVDGKVNLIAAVTKDLTSRFQAGRLIQEVAKAVGGGGGGRPDIAQAGGKDPARLDAALELVYAYVARASARGARGAAGARWYYDVSGARAGGRRCSPDPAGPDRVLRDGGVAGLGRAQPR